MNGLKVLFFVDLVGLAGMLFLFWAIVRPKYSTWYWPAAGCAALWLFVASLGVWSLFLR